MCNKSNAKTDIYYVTIVEDPVNNNQRVLLECISFYFVYFIAIKHCVDRNDHILLWQGMK